MRTTYNRYYSNKHTLLTAQPDNSPVLGSQCPEALTQQNTQRLTSLDQMCVQCLSLTMTPTSHSALALKDSVRYLRADRN
jgi:hypothetical protein